MPLTTRCGRCGRLFPIYAQQLRASGGRVNCPQCGHRFNGRAALMDEPILDGGTPLGRVRLGLGGEGRAPRGSGPWTPPGRQARRPEPAPQPAPVTLPIPEGRPRPGLGGRLLRTLIAVALVLALAGQLLWWNRDRLLQDPQVRGFADSLCVRLHCRLPAVRIHDALEVLKPSLVEDPGSGSMRLALRIRNTVEIPQPTPLLDLELLGPAGDPVAARRFAPRQYGLDEPRLLAPGETIAVTVEMASLQAATSGFKVRLQ